MLRFRAPFALPLAAYLSITATGVAQSERATEPVIDWRDDGSCPRPASLQQELAARLSPDQAALAPAEIQVELRALPAGGYALSLTARGDDDPRARQVELVSCVEAQRAAVMLIATALTAAAPVADEPEAESDPEQPPWSLRVSGLFDVRSVPQLTGGLALGAGYRISRRFRSWADARYLFARESQASGPRAQVDLFTLAIGGGMVWSRARWSGGPLLELELGALRGRASRAATGSAVGLWLCPWGGAALSYTWGRLSLALAAQLGVPLVRPRFIVSEMESYHTSPVAGRALLTLFVALGTKKGEAPGQ